MSALRRSHGGGRDFLQENKMNVSRMETNGRCLAAANARRVPMWRPVVLHYAEKLRPHGLNNNQRRPRQLHGAHESSELRSGLAYPYGFRSDQRRKQPPNPRESQEVRKEQERLQGGWEDQQRAAKKCCHGCHCQRAQQGYQTEAVAPYQGEGYPKQGNQNEAVPYSQGNQIESNAIMTKQGEGDQADRVSLCSRVSRASRRSQARPTSPKEGGDVEASLSARSKASAQTLKSKRSVSQESTRSNATIKSNITVASKSTTASKRTNASRRSQLMEVMPPPTHLEDQKPKEKVQQEPPSPYEGYTPLTPQEREAAIQDAHFKYGKLVEEYNHLPVSEPTLRVRNRKIAIERQLDELDYTINMFDQAHLDMYYRKG
ncbi:uncharacterized protein LOC108104339 [Drosophila eugracilis]|uniref:uncharacterized protein LOC108104339 n=1 Tax=Drosophila eugracilis TaxID=29029 RepID=UPI0007E6E2FD|nr:uncharacterized protein LOC108104339 [Drosophila eugracilis]